MFGTRLAAAQPAPQQDFVQIRKRGERFSFRKDYVFEGVSADDLKTSWKSDTELEVVHPKMFEIRDLWG